MTFYWHPPLYCECGYTMQHLMTGSDKYIVKAGRIIQPGQALYECRNAVHTEPVLVIVELPRATQIS